MAQPGDIAATGRNGRPQSVASHQVATGVFGRCTACNWTTQTVEVAHAVVGHVANFGHDVMIVEHTTRLVSPVIPSSEPTS